MGIDRYCTPRLPRPAESSLCSHSFHPHSSISSSLLFLYMYDPSLQHTFLILILPFLTHFSYSLSSALIFLTPGFPPHHFPLHFVTCLPPPLHPLLYPLFVSLSSPSITFSLVTPSIHLWVPGRGFIADGNGSTPEQIDAARASPLRATSPRLWSLFFVSLTKLLSRGKGGGWVEREGWLDGRGQEM